MYIDPSLRILVVDPTEEVSPVLTQMLTQIGIKEVETVIGPVEGLARLREKKIDIVITDWQTEPMDGAEFIQTVRADETLFETRFLVVTADIEPAKVLEAYRAGADGYAIAPFSARSLANKLTQIRDALAELPLPA
ncbi:MAG: response regulator [Hyphomicrobiales bacterium]